MSDNQDQSSGQYDDYDNINVVVRVRPLSANEGFRKDNQTVQFPGEGQIHVKEPGNGGKSKTYTFNVVFEPEANQDDVFEHCGIRKLIDMSIEGFACTAFAYGQTGSGKTYTLIGNQQDQVASLKQQVHNRRTPTNKKTAGIVQKTFAYLYRQLNNKPDVQFVVQASYLEIYNETVIDLLNPCKSKHLQIRWSKDKGFYAENLFVVECEGPEDLESVLEEGIRNRIVKCHSMNENSSRSHTILTLNITSEIQDPDDPNVYIRRDGKLSLVDLAGSEKTKKTNSKGDTLVEANNINKSLLALGNCISALGDPKKRQGHIPFRDSILTKLLSDSLGGSGVTLMVACVSPSKHNAAETQNTLRYAFRAKRIKNKPIVVMDPRQQLVMSLKREVKLLRMENSYLREQLEQVTPLVNGDNEILSEQENGASAARKEIPNGFQNGPDNDQQHLSVADQANSEENGRRRDSTIVPDFMQENQALRKENADLHQMRALLIRDQEMVCRENERLLRKLADVERVCSRSPIQNESPLFKSFSGGGGGTAPGSRGSNTESLSSSGTFSSSYWNTVLEINGVEDPNKTGGSKKRSSSLTKERKNDLNSRTESPGKPPHHLQDRGANSLGDLTTECQDDDDESKKTAKKRQRRKSWGSSGGSSGGRQQSNIPVPVNGDGKLKKLPPLPNRKPRQGKQQAKSPPAKMATKQTNGLNLAKSYDIKPEVLEKDHVNRGSRARKRPSKRILITPRNG